MLARTPIVLEDGLAGYSLVFESGDQDRHIEARIDPQPGEVSASNNAFGADLAIDHTKIRVLYLEGATDRYAVQRVTVRLVGGSKSAGPTHRSRKRSMEDPDVECTAVMPGGGGGDFSTLVRTNEQLARTSRNPVGVVRLRRDHPEQRPARCLSDQHLAWIEEWIGRRGGGLCMVGGPNSFASGRWNETSVGKMLPVELVPAGRDWDEVARRRSSRSPTARSTRSGISRPTRPRTARCSRPCPTFWAAIGSAGSSRWPRCWPGPTSPGADGRADARHRRFRPTAEAARWP